MLPLIDVCVVKWRIYMWYLNMDLHYQSIMELLFFYSSTLPIHGQSYLNVLRHINHCSVVYSYVYLFVIKFVLIIVVYNIKLIFCLQCHIPFSWPFVYIWGSPQVTYQLWDHKHSLESPPFPLTINVPNLYFYRLLQYMLFNNFMLW